MNDRSSQDDRLRPHPLGEAWRRFWSNAVDEFHGLLILRLIFWHRRHPPAKSGEFYDPIPGLLDGELSTFFAPQPTPVEFWDARQFKRRNTEQYVWDVEFPSPVTLRSPGSSSIRARIWSARESLSERCVIGVDGIVQHHANWFQQLADRLTPEGIDVIMMDAPFNFRRTPKGYRPGQLIVNGDLEHQLAVSRHAILDLWTLVESVKSLRRSIGLVGVSFGGWMSLMLSLLAEELAFVTAVGPPIDMARLLEEGGTIVRAIRRGLGHGPLAEDAVRQAARVVTPGHWRPRLDPSRIHLHAARYDRFVPTNRIRELSRNWATQFSEHSTGHIGLTQSAKVINRVADDITSEWKAPSPARPPGSDDSPIPKLL